MTENTDAKPLLETVENDGGSFIKGVIFILLSALGFAITQAMSNLLAEEVGIYEKMLYHNMVPTIIFAILLIKNKVHPIGKSPGLMFARCFFGFVSTLFIVIATSFSSRPLFEISVLMSTSAIFTMIVAALWLKERVSKYQIAVIIICFIGVIVIVRPSPALLSDPFCLFALLAAIFAGAAYCVVRKLKNYAHPYAVVFCYAALSAIASIPLFIKELIDGAGIPTTSQLFYLMIMGLGISMGQYYLNLAYRQCEASKLSPYSYAQNIYALLISLFIFGQSISPYSYIGAALIIGANYINWWVTENRIKMKHH